MAKLQKTDIQNCAGTAVQSWCFHIGSWASDLQYSITSTVLTRPTNTLVQNARQQKTPQNMSSLRLRQSETQQRLLADSARGLGHNVPKRVKAECNASLLSCVPLGAHIFGSDHGTSTLHWPKQADKRMASRSSSPRVVSVNKSTEFSATTCSFIRN